MKKNLCMIGVFPPLVNGTAKAFGTIINSSVCGKIFNFVPLDLNKLYSDNSGKFTFNKFFGVFKLIRKIRYIKKKYRIDIFYLANSQSLVGMIRDLIILGSIENEKKCLKIIHLHGGGFKRFYEGLNPFLKSILKKYYKTVDRAIVLGNSLKNMFDGIVDDNKICVVPNCVDNSMLITNEEFNAKIQNVTSKKNITVLYLSNMIKSKGYFDVLRAASLCENEEINFVFAGKFYSDAELEEFNDYIKNNGLENKVKYLGTVLGNKKRELLLNSDIFVLPTYYINEGQPISILEAMSAGMPIICTNHAGICDIVSESENCEYVPKKSPTDIANAIKNLIHNREKLKKMAINNRNIVLSKFTEEQYIKNMVRIFTNSKLE